MKKVLLVAAVLIFVVTVMSSCKTHERCPAYSQKVKTEKRT